MIINLIIKLIYPLILLCWLVFSIRHNYQIHKDLDHFYETEKWYDDTFG